MDQTYTAEEVRALLEQAWQAGYDAAERDYTSDDREPHETPNPHKAP